MPDILKLLARLIAAILLVVSLNGFAENEHDQTWHVDFNESGYRLIRGSKLDQIKDDMRQLIAALNQSSDNPEIFCTPAGREPTDPPKVKLLGIDDQHHVVNVEIINDEYLTQKMGTTGAEWFLATVTFTLTEYRKIKFVDFVFREGDHAAPGRYSRQDFLQKGYWQMKR